MVKQGSMARGGAKPRSQPPTVDRFLVALQKTLSRVSRDSAEVPPDQARALIVGEVSFGVELRVRLRDDEKLELDEEAGVPLQLSGRITSDVRVELLEESADANRPQAPPKKSSAKRTSRQQRRPG